MASTGPDGHEGAAAPLEIVIDGESTRPPDLAMVDALARLHLAARRTGAAVRVRGACPELRALLELVGLSELLEPPPTP